MSIAYSKKVIFCFFLVLVYSFTLFAFAQKTETNVNLPTKVIEQNNPGQNIDYLVRLNEQNASWIGILLRAISVLATLMGLAFVTILWLVVDHVKKISEKIKITEDSIKKIEAHEKNLLSLSEEIGSVKNEIRDAKLQEKSLDDFQIGNLIRSVLGKDPNTFLIDVIKNFMWRENIYDLEKIKEIIADKDLRKEIEKKYYQEMSESISMAILIRWCYLIKSKGKKLEELIQEEKELRRKREQTFEEIVKARLKTPPYRPIGLGSYKKE